MGVEVPVKSILVRLALFLCAAPAPVLASPSTPPAGIGREVAVEGLVRTREAFVRRVFRECLEKGEDAARLRQCLLNTRLFKEVEVERKEGGAFGIKVEEKITFIPVPFVSLAGGELRYGAFVVDFNAFGGKEFVGGGGYVSRRGYRVLAFAQDKGGALPGFSLGLLVTGGRQTFELREPREVTDALREDRWFVQTEWGRPRDGITPAVLLTAQRSRYFTVEGRRRPDDAFSTRIGGALEIDKTDYRLFFDEGLRARAQVAYETEHGRSRRRFVTSTLFGSYGLSPWLSHSTALWVAAGGALGGYGRENVARLGGLKGFRGVPPQSLWADRYGAAALEYQVPVWTPDTGTFALAAFGETGRVRVRGGRGSSITHVTGGVGGYVYLKGVAVPGLGVEVGANEPYARRFVSASLGVAL